MKIELYACMCCLLCVCVGDGGMYKSFHLYFGEEQREEEEKSVQVLVVQEADDVEEEQQREERVQALHTCEVDMTEIREVSD